MYICSHKICDIIPLPGVEEKGTGTSTGSRSPADAEMNNVIYVGEWGWGVEGKQVGSMDEESQVRGGYNITFICTPTNQETVSVLEKTQANKTFRT